jgi:lipopolysaccharide export LptBFGC system permease protein LptF
VRITSRYLLLHYLGSAATLLGAFAIIWLAADTLFRIDEVSEHPAGALREIGFRALDVLPLGVPLACVAGVVWSLTRAVRHREITAIRCGGIPLQSTLLPLLIATLCLAGLLMVVEDRVVVPARASLENLEEADATGPRRRPQHLNGRWWYASGGSVFSAGHYSRPDGRLEEVTAFELDASREIRRRIEAKEAVYVSGDLWELRDATVLEFPREGGIDISEIAALRVDLGLTGLDLARALPPIAATSLNQLARRIRDQGQDEARAPLQAAFHARLAQPLAALVLLLFAIRFAIGDTERGDSLARSLLLALGVTALFWLSWTAALLTARSGLVPAALPVWGVLLLGFVLGLGRFRAIAE